MTDYTKVTIRRIKRKCIALAKTGIPGYVGTAEPDPRKVHVSHIHPRAYCLAKLAPYYAVFVVPWRDRAPQVRKDPYMTVQNKTCADVREGDWCAIAYLSTQTYGEPIVVERYEEKRDAMAEEGVK